MSVFTGGLKAGIVDALAYPVDRTSPLGTVRGEGKACRVIIDEGGDDRIPAREMEHGSDVLIYAHPTSPLGQRDCVGWLIEILGGRTFRVESWNVGKNQRTGRVEHIELKVTEQLDALS